jgi:hypothetical protein
VSQAYAAQEGKLKFPLKMLKKGTILYIGVKQNLKKSLELLYSFM